jgi:hypothetical protein
MSNLHSKGILGLAGKSPFSSKKTEAEQYFVGDCSEQALGRPYKQELFELQREFQEEREMLLQRIRELEG